MIRAFAFSVLVAIAALASPGGLAQDYPSKPIRIIVGYPPGAGVDFTARLFADWLKGAFGQPTVVENRPGAGGMTAAEFLSRAEPDGYTLMYAVGSDLVWTRFLTKRATIDPLKDLTPIATVISSVNCVAVNASHSLASFKELVEFSKGNSGKLTYGTSGVQSYCAPAAGCGHAACPLSRQCAGGCGLADGGNQRCADDACLGAPVRRQRPAQGLGRHGTQTPYRSTRYSDD
jgi:tripartite-type tricarboxylate transporter receptor subunit TctC